MTPGSVHAHRAELEGTAVTRVRRSFAAAALVAAAWRRSPGSRSPTSSSSRAARSFPSSSPGAAGQHGVPDPRRRHPALGSGDRDRSRGHGRREPGGRAGLSGSRRVGAGVDPGRGRPGDDGRRQPEGPRPHHRRGRLASDGPGGNPPRRQGRAGGGPGRRPARRSRRLHPGAEGETLIVRGSLRNPSARGRRKAFG